MFWRHRKPEDFNAEIEAHLRLEADRLQEQGWSEAEAMREARRSFGNITQWQEQFYESRGWLWGAQLWQDLRFGLRMLQKYPGAALVATLTLALALGVNTAIFSVVNTALLTPLPVPHPNELVMLTDPNATMTLGGLLTGTRSLLTYPEFQKIQNRTTTLAEVCAVQLTLPRWPIRIDGSMPEQAYGRLVSESYFSTFRVQPAIGRFFTQRDVTGIGKDPYAVISYDYWQRRFGGSPAAIGTSIRLRKASIVIVGVAAKGFRGETARQNPDLWLPVEMQPLVMPSFDGLRDSLPNAEGKLMWLHVFGRRKPGVSMARVQAEMNVLFREILRSDYPATMPPQDRKRALNQHLAVQSAAAGVFPNRKNFTEEWVLLQTLAGFILLVACANLANLQLARATSRSREVAIRLSIGAAKARVVRQFLTESLLLGAIGGLLGVAVAELVLRGALELLSDANGGFAVAAGLNMRVLGFSACATLITGLLFGIFPALRAMRHDVNVGLKEVGRSATDSRKNTRLGKALVAVQIALSMLLIVGAGLFLRTLWNLQTVTLGYPRANLLLVKVDSIDAGYQGARRARLFQDLTARIERISGVRSVTYSDRGLFTGFEGAFAVKVEGFTSHREADLGSAGDAVGPRYFSTIRIPMLLGRQIGVQDLAAVQRVCVINEAFAKHFFAGRNPLGQHVTSTLPDENGKEGQRQLQVIGVAQNARTHSLRGAVDPKFYVPGGTSWLEIRTAGDSGRVLNAVRKVIFAADSQLSITSAKTLRQALSMQNGPSRVMAQLAAGFGVLALLLAATGVYGLLSYELGRRRNEVGIRMALGASRRQIVTMVLKETGFMILAGTVTGIAATAVCTRLLSSELYGLDAAGPRWSLARYEHVDGALHLFGLRAMDPVAIGAAVGVLSGFALLAACAPAARAAATNPVDVLRNE